MKNVLNAVTTILIILFFGWQLCGTCCKTECDTTKCSVEKTDDFKEELQWDKGLYEYTVWIDSSYFQVTHKQIESGEWITEYKQIESGEYNTVIEKSYTVDSSNIGNKGEIYYIKRWEERYPNWDTLKLKKQNFPVWDTLKLSERYIDSLYLSGHLMNSKAFFRHSSDSIPQIIIKEYKERDSLK
jgi:hypothetical protein